MAQRPNVAEGNDPFENLDKAVKRQAAEEVASKRIAGARSSLILGTDARSAFFATLALRLKVVMEWDKVDTMAVDGKNLFVNPDFCATLNDEQLLGVVIHETLHVAMLHHCRREGREPDRWNKACDYSINQIIENAGFKLPKCRLMVGEGEAAKFPKDKNAEFYYTLLRDQDSNPSDGEDESEQGKQGGPGNGDGDGDSDGQGNSESKSGEGKAAADPGGCGGVLDAGDEAESKDSEAEWECAVAQAEQASKSRGTLPGGLARAVSEVLRPAADWRSILREFISSKAKNDYSWTRPNRRFVHQGLYLPGLHSEELGEVVIVVDCSGSICRKTIDVFANEAEAALSAYDCTATILYHDAVVTGREEWTRSDGPLKLNPVGGGGTSHKPVFEEIERAAQMPTCVICLTDLYTDFPAEPSVPTLWAVIGENDSEPPFGRVVKITS